MDPEMPQQGPQQQGPPLDPESLALSQHEWLQFEEGSAAFMRCRRILRMTVPRPRCIDWGLLADVGEAARVRAILGEDTPWTRLFDIADMPTYRLITVEFLSTFRYRAHQAAVREEDDEELPPDVEFSLCGQHVEMSIERFAVHLGIYYEPETVRDDFTQGLTQGEEGVMRAWWSQGYSLTTVEELTLATLSGDVTCLATIPTEMEVEAYFLAKDDGIVAGIALAEMIFNEVDPTLKVEWFKKDGDNVVRGLKFGKVQGRAHSIVVAERVVLNFMQRMSGIATLTKAMADAAQPACILETRKTAPALRLVDKWAVLIGGGQNHRLGLFDMVMIKDNHISIAGGVSNALKSVDQYLEKNDLQMGVEVETRTFEELREVLNYASQNKTFLSRIMLDNMVVPQPDGNIDVSMLKQAVELINGKFETEASGNVTVETVHKIGQTGVTYISSGALTHSVKALDISLKIDTELALEVGRRTKRA
ncbi:hypothetical protein E3N88_38553 [Mikania micrantha]|uniref:nicotinate-nucleotide diphosphorylase (carboxylating) n=1 Tax=Mikania micrantha TaxID=192012 RepID=A0A5N6LUB1_9ASTR|nr:hypothetical protein E3N88_38553 [Mikania micrantha]